MNLFDLSLKLKGFPIERAKHDLIKIQNISDQAYKNYLNVQKQHILQHHLKRNPFYKDFVGGINTSIWENIPVLKKSDLQLPLKNRLSHGYHKKNIHVHKTSGSSGTPLIFAKDKYAHALTWALFMERYRWFNINAASSKQARFYGIPISGIGHYKERIKDILGNRFRFSVFDLSDKEFEKNLNKFKSSSFQYINGYTSVIVQFAKYLEKRKINLKDICPSLKVCITTAEMLFEEDKTLLENFLGIPVVNEYGSAELGLIAFNNDHGDWVVNSEDLYIEILDENDKPLPLGREGRMVITSLYNLAHPFIRYDIGDIGALDEKSTLKNPVLKKLQGRTSDIAILPSGKKAAGLTFYYVTKAVINDDTNVKEFIIEQHEVDTFKIIYSSDKPLSYYVKTAVLKSINQYLEPALNISFERRDVLKRTKAGKLKQFTSFVSEQIVQI